MTDILLSTFLLSIVLLGIHSYFGIEIIRRGIIFTDLAIGQMAAFGASLSLLLLDGEYLYPISLAFSLAGGILIAYVSRKVKSREAQLFSSSAHLEAFIGLLYALGVAGVFIVLSKTAHGMEEFQKLIAADILFTPISEIVKVAILYSILGILLFILVNRVRGVIKDILFFGAFSVTVTSSVRLVGVLVVFALLVAPAYISLRLMSKRPIWCAWVIGTVINISGIVVSYISDRIKKLIKYQVTL